MTASLCASPLFRQPSRLMGPNANRGGLMAPPDRAGKTAASAQVADFPSREYPHSNPAGRWFGTELPSKCGPAVR